MQLCNVTVRNGGSLLLTVPRLNVTPGYLALNAAWTVFTSRLLAPSSELRGKGRRIEITSGDPIGCR